MSRVGLVLGGGGVTGAAYEMATVMALELATGWNADRAEVVVGTSGGAYVAALLRSGRLDLASLVRDDDDRATVAERIRGHVFHKSPGAGLGRWVRHGIIPGLRRPGFTMLFGSPARYHAGGLAGWVEEQVGAAAHAWPAATTLITAYDLAARHRVAFGTTEAPGVSLAQAVAASSATPLLFHPYEVDGRFYVDGGVASGTHADLLLSSPRPLDLVIVMAPMAADSVRKRGWFYERMFDRVGRRSLDEEVDTIRSSWPETDLVVLRPSPQVQDAMRPNPMSPAAAVPTFVRTLRSMKAKLADPEVWPLLYRHLAMSRLVDS